MLPQNNPDRIRILFDDHRLVANAGLLLPATLARHLGLRELVDHHLDLGGAPGHQHLAGAGGNDQKRVIAAGAGIAVMARSLLGQSIGLADGRVQVDGQGRVAGSGPSGPGPGQQLAAHAVVAAFGCRWGRRWRSWAAALGRGRRDSMQGKTIADRAGATLWGGWVVWWTGHPPLTIPSMPHNVP